MCEPTHPPHGFCEILLTSWDRIMHSYLHSVLRRPTHWYEARLFLFHFNPRTQACPGLWKNRILQSMLLKIVLGKRSGETHSDLHLEFLELQKVNWRILLNSDLNLKISVVWKKIVQNFMEKYSHMLFVKNGDSMGKKIVLGKLEIWHTGKLGPAQKKSQNNCFTWGLIHNENWIWNIQIFASIWLSHNILQGKFEAKLK